MPHLHSIYLTDDANRSDQLPWRVATNIQSFRFYHPGFKHQLYRNDDARAFIERHFDREVLDAYDELVPYAYKADLLRLCLLFELGGIYADVAMHFFAPLEESPTAPRAKLFRDNISQAPWIVSNALIYAPAGVELFENCIRQIVRNVREGYYGYNQLCPTGPNLLGAEFAKWGKLEAVILGEVRPILRSDGGARAGYTYLSAGGKLIGAIGKTSSGLAGLGSDAGNDYNKLYERRQIYRRELAGPPVWTHEDYRRRGTLMTVATLDEKAGRFRFPKGIALYGPYIGLGAGQHTARFVFKAKQALASQSPVTIDVAAGGVRIRPLESVAPRPCDGGFEYSLTFSLDRPREAVEVRLHLEEEQELSFDRMELTSDKGDPTVLGRRKGGGTDET